ncbi:RNA pseudouridylate synthase domain-containing protein 1 isoform X1 [Halyomorpha halys]|uniref:RNA pseudouridylate synthase domain-containing protein 1 isoform X1 n=1 Tax=Halyomorpha halys TaxID=286706 RepID=UPI0006D4F979|nr:RNA pseudouridylate synthase domain-containing protein 1-like [Halyomorpha halys]
MALFRIILRCLYGLEKIWSFVIFKLRGSLSQKIDVLHQSDNFLVINKGHDIVINSNDPLVAESLHSILSKLYPSLVNPKLRHYFHFVHRLDFVTSGVLCLALNKKAASAAALCFENRSAKKYYMALVRGHVSGEIIDIKAAIGECSSEKNGNHKMCVEDDAECLAPRTAFTRLLVLERGLFAAYPASKVLLRPVTGRRHQIRVHCHYLGHTIVGDYTYSCGRDVNPDRTFLHALRLILPNAVEPLDIRTGDPFQNIDKTHGWIPVEKINDLQTAFTKIENDISLNL